MKAILLLKDGNNYFMLETMKKTIIFALSLITLINIGCVEDNFEAGNTAISGEVIQFNVGGPNTRTEYNTSDPWQIDWMKDGTDKVRIYCAEAWIGGENGKHGNQFADYNVSTDMNGDGNTTTEDGESISDATINGTTISEYISYRNGKLIANSNGLEWGDKEKHTFYAVYPADDSKLAGYSFENGIITFNYNSNQTVTLTGASENINGITVYNTTPDMSNAYMVAKAEYNKSEITDQSKITLSFDPIMSTLEVTVRGTNNSAIPVTITGISIVNKFENNRTVIHNGQFQYDLDYDISDIPNDSYPFANGGVISNEDGITTLTTYVNIKDASGNIGKQIQSTEAVKVTAFVPPIVLHSDYTAVQVHYAANFVSGSGGNGVLKAKLVSGDAETKLLIPAGSKRRVTLAQIPTPLTNNWITPLDDNIYVSQLSIPGSHDAATGDGTSFSLGKTQDLDLEDQWTLGIRCFDIRPRYGSEDNTKLYYGNNLWINHGGVSTAWSMDGVVNLLKTKLEANPGEFAIVIMRHETEGDNTSSSWPDEMAKALASYKNLTNNTTQESLTIDFKPDLTIEECRGKILFMMRSWTPYTGGPTVGGYHSWSHDAAAVQTTIWGPSGPEGTLYVQDYYNLDLGFTIFPDYYATTGDAIYNKQNAICDMLDLAAKSHKEDAFTNTWFYNHSSGYIYYTIFEAGVSTTDGYRGNAANNHPLIYNYLLGNTVTINGKQRRKEIGSAGIVLMDYVGVSTSGGNNVYGHLCPQVIIDNNYKYHLKRKGE